MMRLRRLVGSLRALPALALLLLPVAAQADWYVPARRVVVVPARRAFVPAPRLVVPFRPAFVPARRAFVPVRRVVVPARAFYR